MSVSQEGSLPPVDTICFAGERTSTWPLTIYDTSDPPQTPPRSYITGNTTLSEDADSAKQLKKSVKTVVGNGMASTPAHQDIEMSRPDPLVEERKKILKKELGPFVELAWDSALASSLYRHCANRKRVKEFLQSTEVYDWKSRRWVLPESRKNLMEVEMYKPLVKLLNAIFEWFWGKDAAHREAIDTHLTQLPHKEPVSTANYSSPDISVKAEGSSFQLPHKDTTTSIGYSNMAAFFEVKVTSQDWSVMEELLQLAGYARQIFIQQPNRRFVRALIITEQSFRLFHFDRSGAQLTQAIDIHQNARIFIRLVLGLCSLEESDVGLDNSIEWEVREGRKVSGTLTTRQENNVYVTYQLADVEPTVLSYEVRGRGLTSWRVVDPASEEILLVRDMWRPEDQLSEDFYLEKAKGTSGIVQMISFEYNREATAQFRDFGNSPHPLFRNRIAMRVVLDSHGKSIKHFKSPKELLCALRDAIAGHRALYKKEVLHRQITLDNIMLGRSGALAGNRGVLIGLDMAKIPGSDASAERHAPGCTKLVSPVAQNKCNQLHLSTYGT
ncbi:hypothetical protein H1R20_g424, partial [Candolleomyces eurysporus]